MLGILICDDCAQILEAFNLIQFITVDSDVHADTICVVSHQFGLLCTNLPKATEVLSRRSTGEASSSWASKAINVFVSRRNTAVDDVLVPGPNRSYQSSSSFSSSLLKVANVISKTMRRSSLIISSSHITFSIITLFN